MAPGGMAYMGSGGFNGLGPMGYGMGAGSLGTQYGTGGMGMSTNIGGWGDGLDDNWGHSQAPQGPGTLDNDPHLGSSYRNPDFQPTPDNSRSFYHPAL